MAYFRTLLLAFPAVLALAQPPATYQVIETGALPFSPGPEGYLRDSTSSTASPGGLNNSSQIGIRVVSTGGVPASQGQPFGGPLGGGRNVAARWDRGFLRDLRWSTANFPIANPHLGAVDSRRQVTISSNGNVAGSCDTIGGNQPAFFGSELCLSEWAVRFMNGGWVRTGSLGSNPFNPLLTSTAYGVNASGVVIGIADGDNATRSPFSYSASMLALPGAGPNFANLANAINDAGTIAGQQGALFLDAFTPPCPIGQPLFRPVQFAPSFSDLFQANGGPALCTASGSAFAISASGNAITGFVSSPTTLTDSKPFLIYNGAYSVLPLPPGATGQGYGVNNNGDVVGQYSIFNGPTNAPFVYIKATNTVHNLLNHLPVIAPGLTQQQPLERVFPVAINDSGQILINALFSNQITVNNRTFLLSPTSFCQSETEFVNLPQSPQGGVETSIKVRFRQKAGGNCLVPPTGRIDIVRNNTLVTTVQMPYGQQFEAFNPLGWVEKEFPFTFQQGSNVLQANYTGNGLFSPSSSQPVNVAGGAGPTCQSTAPNLLIQRGGFRLIPGTGGGAEGGGTPDTYIQQVSITNNTGAAIQHPVSLAIRNLTSQVSLLDTEGTIQLCTALAPLNTPFVSVAQSMATGERVTITLRFLPPNRQTPIQYQTTVLAGPGTR